MPISQLDDIDRRLLKALQSNARMPNAELAKLVGLSPSPCLRRLRILENTGIIDRYVVLLDQERVGLPVSVFISIRLERQHEEALENFEAKIKSYDEVLECYLMTGQRDYLLRVVAQDLRSYERFLKDKLTRIDGVASIESSFALSQIKYTNSLPLPVS